MGFCPNCGNRFEENDLFCEHCGENLSEYQTVLADDIVNNDEPVTDWQANEAITMADADETANIMTDETTSRRYIPETRSGFSGHIELPPNKKAMSKKTWLLIPLLLLFLIAGAALFVTYGNAIATFLGLGHQPKSGLVVTTTESEQSVTTTTVTETTIDSSTTAVTTVAETTIESTTNNETTVVESTNNNNTTVAVSNENNGNNTTVANDSSNTTVATQPEPAQTTVAETIAPAPIIPIPATKAATQFIYDNTLGTIGGNKGFYFKPLTYNGQPVTSDETLAINADTPIRSASIIKLFILLAYEQQKEAQRIDGNEVYTYNYNDVVGGTGDMQNNPRNYTYDEIARLMIVDSDNMGANVLVNRIGGIEVVNQAMASIGFTNSSMNRYLMDLNAPVDNYVTAREVGEMLSAMYQKTLVSPKASEEMLSILAGQKDTKYLRANLPAEAQVYNKTGIIQTAVLGDAAIIVSPKGAFVVVSVNDSGDNGSQQNAMNQVGAQLYQLYNQ